MANKLGGLTKILTWLLSDINDDDELVSSLFIG